MKWFILGFVLGSLLFFWNKPINNYKVITLKGEPLKKTEIKKNAKEIIVHVEYDGTGQSNIIIPNKNKKYNVFGGVTTSKNIILGGQLYFNYLNIGCFAKIPAVEFGVFAGISF